MYRAGFNGNDVIVNAIRRGNRNIRFAPPLSRRPRETLLSRSMSLSVEREEMREERACDGRGAKQRVYVSPVTDRVNVGKDEEGLRFPGWTDGGEGAATGLAGLEREEGIGERDG